MKCNKHIVVVRRVAWMSGALAARGASEEGNRGRVEATKVRRYWPGKRPDWVGNEEEEDLAVPSTAPAAEDEPTSVQRTGVKVQ